MKFNVGLINPVPVTPYFNSIGFDSKLDYQLIQAHETLPDFSIDQALHVGRLRMNGSCLALFREVRLDRPVHESASQRNHLVAAVVVLNHPLEYYL